MSNVWYIYFMFILKSIIFPSSYKFTSSSSINSRMIHLTYFDAGNAKTSTYVPIPEDYNLEQVVVFHRHGDRSQISRTLGGKYPESDEVTKAWLSKLPDDHLLSKLAVVARKGSKHDEVNNTETLKDYLYSGWDRDNYPYGQLTNAGVEQMKSLGSLIASRYVSKFNKNIDTKDDFLLRSTDSCRTVQSLRSFLLGYFDFIGMDIDTSLSASKLPTIRTLAKDKETLFPQADKSCEGITVRRSILMAHTPLHNSMKDYFEFEAKMKDLLGFDHVPWLTVKEVISCQLFHGLPTPPTITVDDEEKLSHVAAWLWGQLFHDKILNRLAIGRFVKEFFEDLSSVTSLATETIIDGSINPTHGDKPKFIIYSGHDSTLVPFMCALDIYDDTWPPYASYLALEIVKLKNGERRVRAIFNDEERKLSHSDEVWCPYEMFVTKLQQFEISYEEYDKECLVPSQNVYTTLDATSSYNESELIESRKEMEEEIQATLGGTTKKM